MSDLICPKCERSGLRWLDPDMDDLIFKGIMECKNKGCKAQYTMEQFRQAWLDKHPPDPKDQTIAALRTKLQQAEEERDRLTMIAEEISKQATIEHYNIEDARKSLSVIQKRHALELAAAQARAERAEGALEPIKAVDEYVNRWLPEYDPLPHGKAWTAIREAIRLANEPESVTSEE